MSEEIPKRRRVWVGFGDPFLTVKVEASDLIRGKDANQFTSVPDRNSPLFLQFPQIQRRNRVERIDLGLAVVGKTVGEFEDQCLGRIAANARRR